MNFRNTRQRLRIGDIAALGGLHPVVVTLESQDGFIFRIHFAGAFDLGLRFHKVSATLRQPGQLQTHLDKSIESILFVLLNRRGSNPDPWEKSNRLFINLGRSGQIPLFLGTLGFEKFQVKLTDGLLPADGFLLGGLRGVLLGEYRKGAGENQRKT